MRLHMTRSLSDSDALRRQAASMLALSGVMAEAGAAMRNRDRKAPISGNRVRVIPSPFPDSL